MFVFDFTSSSVSQLFAHRSRLRILGGSVPFDQELSERLKVYGAKTPPTWPAPDAIVEFDPLEPKPVLIEDSEDPKRRVFVFPQYYAAFSDSNGQIEIQGLQADSKIKFCFVHPLLGHDFADVDIAGEKIAADGSIELTLGNGLNDFGNIYVTPAIKRYLERSGEKAKP